MKKFLKFINGSPLLAFLLALGVSGTFMAVKEYRRVAKFPDKEAVQFPAGVYVGGEGSDPDPTLSDQNRLTRVLSLTTSTLDAGLFTNDTCLATRPIQTLTGARVGDVCLATFKATNVLTANTARTDFMTCQVTDAGVVSLTMCPGTIALDAGQNIPVYGTARILVISNQ